MYVFRIESCKETVKLLNSAFEICIDKVDSSYLQIGLVAIKSKNIYKKKITRIISNAKMNLDLWKKLEKKYQLIKNRNNSNHIKFYKTEREYYKIELQKSISSLLLILVNIKSLN